MQTAPEFLCPEDFVITEDTGTVHLDVGQFDPHDEEAFFNAVLILESDGEHGGTDISRAEMARRFGLVDRTHWQVVKESMYSILIRRHGSPEEVGQREINWRSGSMQRHMQSQVARAAAGGGFAPVEGVSVEAWAAINAAVVAGSNLDDLLLGAGLDPSQWARVTGEWNARMARDTTFAIAQAYSHAFQSTSQGPYAVYAREAAAARAANRDVQIAPPMAYEHYYELVYEQSYAAKQARDPATVLRAFGLTIVDWTDLSTYMGYLFHRTAVRDWALYQAIHERVAAKLAAKYPGIQADVVLS